MEAQGIKSLDTVTTTVGQTLTIAMVNHIQILEKQLRNNIQLIEIKQSQFELEIAELKAQIKREIRAERLACQAKILDMNRRILNGLSAKQWHILALHRISTDRGTVTKLVTDEHLQFAYKVLNQSCTFDSRFIPLELSEAESQIDEQLCLEIVSLPNEENRMLNKVRKQLLELSDH